MAGLQVSRNTAAAVMSLGMLYFGKISSIAVAFVFLPLYSRLLGAEQFGVVAVILSLQALLVLLDLGLSTLLGRDVAVDDGGSTKARRLATVGEATLCMFYLALLALVGGWKALGGLAGLSAATAVGSVGLFWLLVTQNLFYTGMLAKRAYLGASTIQVLLVLGRALATAYVLSYIAASLEAFLATQVAFSAFHLLVQRAAFYKVLAVQGPMPQVAGDRVKFAECVQLIRRGRALVLSGAAGAAAMQLDKPIVSALMGPAEVAPYFLAATLSATPVAIFAGPVVQYFQPRVTIALSRGDRGAYRSVLRHFYAAIAIAAVLPVIVMVLFCDAIVAAWLGNTPDNAAIAAYAKTLLTGYGIAALGYVPYVVLVARQDFKFHATVSAAAAVLVLAGVAVASLHAQLSLACFAYVAYFMAITLAFLLRSNWHKSIVNPNP